MTPDSIKAQIALRGLKQRDLLAKLKCREDELSQTIQGHRVNPEIRKRLAALFGMTASEMFDDEFDAVIQYRRSA